MSRRTNQSGSIASYIVIGVILVSGMVGAIYFLNQRDQQQRKEQATAALEKQKSTQSQTKPQTTSVSEKTETNSSNGTSNTAEKAETTNDLPVTGPNSTVANIIGLFMLSVFVTGYGLSRRKLTHSL